MLYSTLPSNGKGENKFLSPKHFTHFAVPGIGEREENKLLAPKHVTRVENEIGTKLHRHLRADPNVETATTPINTFTAAVKTSPKNINNQQQMVNKKRLKYSGGRDLNARAPAERNIRNEKHQ